MKPALVPVYPLPPHKGGRVRPPVRRGVKPPARRRKAPGPGVLRVLMVGVLAAAAALTLSCTSGADVPPGERRAQQLNETIMCPVCPGESIDQSQNRLAGQMRGVVDEKLDEGWTDAQVRDFFVERYGPSVLLEPPREGLSLVAWLLPPLAVAAAAAGLFFTVRAMRGRGGTARAGTDVPEMSGDEKARYFDLVRAAVNDDAERRKDRA